MKRNIILLTILVVSALFKTTVYAQPEGAHTQDVVILNCVVVDTIDDGEVILDKRSAGAGTPSSPGDDCVQVLADLLFERFIIINNNNIPLSSFSAVYVLTR